MNSTSCPASGKWGVAESRSPPGRTAVARIQCTNRYDLRQLPISIAEALRIA